MNQSKLYYSVLRELYNTRKQTTSIIKSRSYTLARSLSTIAHAPLRFSKKAVVLLFKNPRKMLNILLGKKTIQDLNIAQDKLTSEYKDWIDKVETPSLRTTSQRRSAEKLKIRPLISLITPVFNPPVYALKELVNSLINQTYTEFEVLLYNFGDDPEVKIVIDEYAQKDKRIKVKHDLPNGGIGKNSNLCLKDVKGEFTALLDHDDALMPNALYECVKEINKHDPDFIYTDKDKITEDGRRFEPFFKPDWSPEMALGGNFMTHFSLMRTSIVRDLGGWDPSTDGAQDWDLFLRITEKTDKISHVPIILYHWRTIAGSTASGIASKPYALAAQRKAVKKHLNALKLNAEPFHDQDGAQYVEWKKEAKHQLIIIQALFNDEDNIENLIESAERNSGAGTQLLIVCEDEKFYNQIKNTYEALSQRVSVKQYKIGGLLKTIELAINKYKPDSVVYLVDSLKSVECSSEGGWINQLVGWLNIPGVNMSGGGQYTENGYVVDIGSFFDPAQAQFFKYHFGTGFRSGYLSYIQWIKNFILVSERVVAFKPDLINTLISRLGVVDDHELMKGLALVNYAQNSRAVYDPLIKAIDKAPFEFSPALSPQLIEFFKTDLKQLARGDPYYNTNADQHYSDPKPRLKDETVLNSPKSIDVVKSIKN